MDKKEAINKLEDARDLIVEAQYMIEEILPQVNILGTKKMEILEPVTDIIKMLSQLAEKTGEAARRGIEKEKGMPGNGSHGGYTVRACELVDMYNYLTFV